MSIKSLIALNEAFMPLQEHLQRLPPAVHSERFRTLASIGLQIQQGKLVASICNPFGGDREVAGAAGPFLEFPVVLNEAYPDLLVEIQNTPSRLRAERLRCLATTGLYALAHPEGARQGAVARLDVDMAAPEPAQKPDGPQRQVSRPAKVAPSSSRIPASQPVVAAPAPVDIPEPASADAVPVVSMDQPASQPDQQSVKLKPRVARMAKMLGA